MLFIDGLNVGSYLRDTLNADKIATQDEAILECVAGSNVVLATPTNLWAILKTVAFTWRQDVLTDSARELFELAHQLYERMGTLMREKVIFDGRNLYTPSVMRDNGFRYFSIGRPAI